MNEQSVIRVLIADDHPVVREGLAAMINRRPDMQVVAEVENGRFAITAYQQHRPDIALIDLRMPELGGVDAINAIRADFPEARIIILTTYDGDEDIYRGLQAGAKAYLLKDAPRAELLEAIRAVHAGQRRIPPDIAAKLADRMAAPQLTPRELDVLRLIVAGHSNREIGLTLTISEGTVKAHVNNLLGKLGVTDRTQAVTEALRRGLVHLDEQL
ncbi:MAG: response regulator transcription factor [Ardenticatenaceae bacterium]|nr:response regulator transcription factor [Ardenticatenaceae bacterium]